MNYPFREIRKGERDEVLAFAKQQGSAIKPDTLRHSKSLMVKTEDGLVAAALCVEQSPAHFAIEIIQGESVEDALVTELADRCLRKMQSEGIASARINSHAEAATQTIWQSANWLDQIEETSPPPEQQAA